MLFKLVENRTILQNFNAIIMLFDLAKKKNSEEPHAKCERPVI